MAQNIQLKYWGSTVELIVFMGQHIEVVTSAKHIMNLIYQEYSILVNLIHCVNPRLSGQSLEKVKFVKK